MSSSSSNQYEPPLTMIELLKRLASYQFDCEREFRTEVERRAAQLLLEASSTRRKDRPQLDKEAKKMLKDFVRGKIEIEELRVPPVVSNESKQCKQEANRHDVRSTAKHEEHAGPYWLIRDYLNVANQMLNEERLSQSDFLNASVFEFAVNWIRGRFSLEVPKDDLYDEVGRLCIEALYDTSERIAELARMHNHGATVELQQAIWAMYPSDAETMKMPKPPDPRTTPEDLQEDRPGETRAVYLGDGRIKLPEEVEPILITNPTHVQVLEYLVENRVASTKQLEKVIGYPSKVCKELCENYKGALSAFIIRPGKKSKNGGGYRTTIIDGRKKDA